jgi:hypothetical protein
MTTVEILYQYAMAPTESATFALASARDVYGIRKFKFDRESLTLCVEYDATRLSAAAVTRLVRQAGLDVTEELTQVPQLPEPVPAPAA